MCKVEDTTGVNNGSTAQTMVSSVSLSAFFFFSLDGLSSHFIWRKEPLSLKVCDNRGM